MCCILTVRSKLIGRQQPVISLAFEIVFLDVFEKVIETSVVMFMGLFFAGLSVHNDYIKPIYFYCEIIKVEDQCSRAGQAAFTLNRALVKSFKCFLSHSM